MTRICAWCGKFLGYKPGKGTTHGICPPCAQNVRDQIRWPDPDPVSGHAPETPLY
ncbi:hypothetical protein LCGC14_1212320 [marine sediment metagenome]|uniref:Uncharacterized protein n=1 Tax=marine sediment metagenome TaxID=412755 RepID=A0A0F9M122_9ZZZZ